MELNEIIRRVISVRPEISREEFLKKVEEKKKELGNYFADETIAKIVASELGAEISEKFEGKLEISIKDLVSGLNDVTVSGRVFSVFPVRTFKRRLKGQGKVARLVIDDETGKLKVVLWDENVKLVEEAKLRKGQKIRILHGYVRESLRGELELHVGERGEIEILEEGNVKIEELKVGDGPVCVVGTVISPKPLIRTVKTSKGENIPVASFEIEDETGKVWVSMWRKLAEKLEKEKLERGTVVKLKNFYVKRGFNEGLEIFSRKDSSFEVVSKPI
jgi:replication factor A1